MHKMSLWLLLIACCASNFAFTQPVANPDPKASQPLELEPLHVEVYYQPAIHRRGGTITQGDETTSADSTNLVQHAAILNIKKSWPDTRLDISWTRHIYDHITYPDAAFGEQWQGKVYTQFQIDTAGKVVEASIIRGVHPALDSVTLEALHTMPQWSIDQLVQNKHANIKEYVGTFILPVRFELKQVTDKDGKQR